MGKQRFVLLLVLCITTFFPVHLSAVEIKIDSSVTNTDEITNFYKKIDEFLSKEPFPDSAIDLKVAEANVKKDAQNKNVLYSTLNIEYNNQYFLSLQQIFEDYKKTLESETSARRCSVSIAGKLYSIPCKIGLEVTKKLYASAKYVKDDLSFVGLGLEDENKLWYDYVHSNKIYIQPFLVFIEYRLKSKDGVILQKGLIRNRGSDYFYGAIVRARHRDIENILPLPDGINVWYYDNIYSGFEDGETKINTVIKSEPIILDTKPEDIKDIEFFVANTRKWDEDKRQKEEYAAQKAKEKQIKEARRSTPEYKRSVIAEELCQQYNALSQANQAIKNQNEVDLATGTTNLYEKRQLGAAKLYIEKEIAKLKKEYNKIGGGDFSRKKHCE